MRRFLLASLGIGALIALLTPDAESCHRRGRGRGAAGGSVYYMASADGTYYERQYSTVSRQTVTVTMTDGQYEPRTMNVAPGTTVRWVNQGQHKHTVTSNNNSFESGDIQPGQSFIRTFSQPGAYNYYCRHHAKMQGTIVVGNAADGSGTARPNGY